jgi:hypothetical protein
LIALLVSEQTKLFGFMESNYRPAIIVAIASEASAAVILLLVSIVSWEGKRPVSRPNVPLPDHSQPRRWHAIAAELLTGRNRRFDDRPAVGRATKCSCDPGALPTEL